MKTILGTKISKCVCAALSLVILCGVPFTGSVYSAEEELGTQQTSETKTASSDVLDEAIGLVEVDDITTLKKLGKIDDRLCEILERAGDDEFIPVSIWITGIDFEEVEKRVEAEVGLSRKIIEQKSDAIRNDFVTNISARLYSADALTALSDNDFIAAFSDYKELNKAKMEQFDNDVETYIIEQRNIAKEMHIASNGDFVNAFLSDAKDIYVYGAFPIIDCSITKERILYLASLNSVESISSNADDDMLLDCMVDDVELSLDEAAPERADEEYVLLTQKNNSALFDKLRSNATLTWETAAEVLGKDFSLCGGDTHYVHIDASISDSYVILQSDLNLYEDHGVVGVTTAEEQKKNPLCLKTVTVFMDITGTADEDKLYEYLTDFESGSGVGMELVGQSRLNTYHCEIKFYCTAYNQLIACVAYDDCLFEISYGFVDAENILDSIDLICSGFEEVL